MTIKHIHVEGGFLTGLDLRLQKGLNVLIGARGTGKTSVIELIRYAFGARNQTTEGMEHSLKHARATLADGEVRLTVEDVFDEVTFARTSTEDAPRGDDFYLGQQPIIFSQKEIENIALSEQGRLHLIDAFIGDVNRQHDEIETIERLTALDRSIRPLSDEIRNSEQEVEKRDVLLEILRNLHTQQSSLQQSTAVDHEARDRVKELSKQLTAQNERINAHAQLGEVVAEWVASLSDLPFNTPDNIEVPGDPDFSVLTMRFEQAAKCAKDALGLMRELESENDERRNRLNQQRVKTEGQFREARKIIDDAIAGAGALEKRIHDVQQDLVTLENLERQTAERNATLAALRIDREALLDKLEGLRNSRFLARKEVADRLNTALAPMIKISIQRSARYADYVSALVDALRGSGLKYNDVAISLAQSVSPRELVGYIENGDFDRLSSASGLPRDRASRVINALADAGTAQILTVKIEDTVRLRLLDGTEYKDVRHLSAGQRCTVILPIVFQHSDRILVIDQPEDHIDNAFIVKTLIQSLRNRATDTQIILATHNANIPVLGNADWVVQMTSDGRHGSVAVAEPLDGRGAVTAITSVMEGGLKAFRDRANFYDVHTL